MTIIIVVWLVTVTVMWVVGVHPLLFLRPMIAVRCIAVGPIAVWCIAVWSVAVLARVVGESRFMGWSMFVHMVSTVAVLRLVGVVVRVVGFGFLVRPIPLVVAPVCVRAFPRVSMLCAGIGWCRDGIVFPCSLGSNKEQHMLFDVARAATASTPDCLVSSSDPTPTSARPYLQCEHLVPRTPAGRCPARPAEALLERLSS